MSIVLCRAGEVSDALPDTVMLEEISVSAIKQSRVGTKDVSSTVLDRDDVERRRITTVKGMSDMVPNLYIPDYGSRITSSIYVRGIGARMDQPAVGLIVDNVPIMNKDAYDFDMADIAKIEMLRGPQSTLYGRNTMGGLITINTLSPLKWQGVRLLVEYGSGNSWRGSASIYHKFNNNIGLSLNAYYNSSDGFFENEYNGEKCDWDKQFTGRAKLEWRLSDNLMMTNVASVGATRQGGYPYEHLETGKIAYNDTCFYRRTTFNDGLTLKWFTDKFTLASITSAQYIDDNMTLDQDFLPLEYFTLTQAKREWNFTQDLILRGAADSSYKWLVGMFAFYKHLDMNAPVTFKDYGISQLIEAHRNEANTHYPISWSSREFPLNSEFTSPVWGVALYHQSTYDLDRWHFNLGLRFDYERTSLDYYSHCDTGYDVYSLNKTTGEYDYYKYTQIVIDERGSLGSSFTELLPKFSVTFDLMPSNGSTIFASVAKGYKAGGFNTQMFSDVLQQKLMKFMGIGATYEVDDIVSYRPEKSWNYEIGSHLVIIDNVLTSDLSLFYIDCQDQQLTVFPDGTTTGRIMTNAGKTESYGVEATFAYRPISGLDINMSYGYTNAKFKEFDNGKENYAGKYIPYVPQHTLFVGATYTQSVNNKWLDRIVFDASMRGVGEIYWNESNDLSQPFYALLDASVAFETPHCTLELWGKNLTDTEYHTFYFMSIGNEFRQKGKPVNFGITLRVNI